MTVAHCGRGRRGSVSVWRRDDSGAAATLIVADNKHDNALLAAATIGSESIVRCEDEGGHGAQLRIWDALAVFAL